MTRRGFTLTELLVAIGLSAIVSLVVFTMFTAGLAMSRRLAGEESVYREAYQVSERLAPLVHESDLSLATCSNSSVLFPHARDSQGRFCTDPNTGQPQWQECLLVYRENNGPNLRLLHLSLKQVGSLPVSSDNLKRLASGEGELLTDSLSKFNLEIEQVSILPDPVVGNGTPPAAQVPGLLHLTFSLAYQDRSGRKRNFDYGDRLEGWNSFERNLSPVLPIPTATPSPPNHIEHVPEDWDNQ